MTAVERASPARLRELIATTTDPTDLAALMATLEAMELAEAETDPSAWVRTLFPSAVPAPFATHHRALLGWAWGIQPRVRARPHVDVWARGGAKSTLAELCTAMVAARRSRTYGVYVGATDDKAEEHLANIATLLESPRVARLYPELGQPLIGKLGHSRGWRANRLRTASGFTIDALGIETAMRGIKVDDDRPDWFVIDDIDNQRDGPAIVRKKLDVISYSLLPAGAPHATTLVIQNLVHKDGVVAQIADGRAEILRDRIQSGPIPAVEGDFHIEETGDLERPWRIVGGTFTWAGQGREVCEQQLATFGPTVWNAECQHKPRIIVGGMYEDVIEDVRHCERSVVPDLVRKSIAVDPALTDTDSSDSHGVQCDGIDTNGVIYRLRSWEERAAPGEALTKAILWAYEEGVSGVLIEMNTGSDMSGRSIEESWRKLFRDVDEQVRRDYPQWAEQPRRRPVKVRATSSTGSKATRSSQMHADYERPGRIVHVYGDHEILEAALGRVFVVKPFDLADAAWYSWNDLRRPRAGSGGAEGRLPEG